MKKKLTLLAAALLTLASSIISLAGTWAVRPGDVWEQQKCPVTLYGQEPIETGVGTGLTTFYKAIIIGDDRIEESDIQVEAGATVEMHLNTDGGKMTEYKPEFSSGYGNPYEDYDYIYAKTSTQSIKIYLYRMPSNMTSASQLKENAKFAIYANENAKTETVTGWQKDANGWWYINPDGSYPVDEWKELGGVWYYFGYQGYIWTNTWTPDGYYVNEDGAWVPGYDEPVREGTTVTYTVYDHDYDGDPAEPYTVEVPVSYVSDINRVYDNLTAGQYTGLDRVNTIWFATYNSINDILVGGGSSKVKWN